MACTCKVGPGKFEGEPARVFMAYQQALLGNADVTANGGDFFKAPFMFDADASVVRDAREYGYCAECVENYDEPSVYGMVIWERSDGFVSAQTFDTEKEYDAAVNEAENAEAENDDGD